MDLRLRTRPSTASSNRAVLVEVAGELDLHSAPQLRAELGRVLENQAPPLVVVDLTGVTFLDSTGVGVLVGALKRAREAGGALHFCGAQPRVRRVFEITGLIGVLPLFDRRDEALAAFDEDEQDGESAGQGMGETLDSTNASASNGPARFSGAVVSTGEAQ